MSNYKPELGQAAFGQPFKEFNVSPELESALMAIETRLCLKMAQHVKNYDSPFANTGNKFSCGTFSVEAYSWDDDVDQPWNFKWRDVEVSWYKYFGRGMSVNQNLSIARIEEMLVECYEAIALYGEEEAKPTTPKTTPYYQTKAKERKQGMGAA